MSGAKSRTKGAGAERELAALLQEELGVHMQRRLRQYQAGGCDLEVSEEQHGCCADFMRRLSIEVKRHAKATPALRREWWGQAVEQAGLSRMPVLALREDRAEWRFVLPLQAFGHAWAMHGRDYENTAEIGLPAFCVWVRESAE